MTDTGSLNPHHFSRYDSPRELLRGASRLLGLAWHAAPIGTLGYLGSTAVVAASPVAVAWLTKITLDWLTTGHQTGLAVLAGLLALAGMAVTIAGGVQQYLLGEVGRRVTLVTKDGLYSAINNLQGMRQLENPEFRDQLMMAEQHSHSGSATILDAVVGTVQAVLTTAGFVSALMSLSQFLAVLVLCAGIPALFAEIHLSRQRAKTMSMLAPIERREYFYSELMTDLSAAQEIRMLGLGKIMRTRMLTELRISNARRRTLELRDLTYQGLLSTVSAIIAAFGLIWAVREAGQGSLSPGDIAVFIAAVGGVQVGLVSVTTRMGMAHNALLMFGHYRSMSRLPEDLPKIPASIATPKLSRGIELRNVWFRYDTQQPWILRGVNLWLPAGQATALVGHNGSGKSTLIKLLCRLYDPIHGSIHWDGIDLRDMDVVDLRRHLGTLFQDYFCYDLSAEENIGLGDAESFTSHPQEHHAKNVVAATRAGVHELVSLLPQGYKTMLSRTFYGYSDTSPEAGVQLSGGQWQRLALARTLVRDRCDLVILDEPTAGLDAVAEHEVHRSLTQYRRGLTSILISHRLGAIQNANRIAVIVDGKIDEIGTHKELIASQGTYAHLFSLQADTYNFQRSRSSDI